MSTRDKKEQTRRAADATDVAEDREVDPRAAHFKQMRAAKGRPNAAAGGKGRDARALRESKGANAQRGNKATAGKDADKDADKDPDKEEEEEVDGKADDLFWKHLVWGAYRSKKRRGEE